VKEAPAPERGKKYKEKKNKFNNDWNYKLICNGEAPSSSNAYGDKISTLNQQRKTKPVHTIKESFKTLALVLTKENWLVRSNFIKSHSTVLLFFS